MVGRLFWVGAVASVSERGRWAIEEALRQLEHRQLVRRRHESAVADDSEWVFEHALIRDVAYRSIVRRLRAEKHHSAAEWMSSLSGDRRDRADAIAFHYLTAFQNAHASGTSTPELRHEALNALRAAAERAVSIHSHAEAARLWRQAVDLCAPDDALRPRLLLEYGKALAIVDEPAAEILDEAAAALVASGELSCAAEAESTNGWLLSLAGREDMARTRDERALELVRDAATVARQGADPDARGHARAWETPRRTPRHSTCSRKHCPSRSSSGFATSRQRRCSSSASPDSTRESWKASEDNEKALASCPRAEFSGLAELLRQPRGRAEISRLARGVRGAPRGRRARRRAVRHPGAGAAISRRAGDRPLLHRAVGRRAVPARGVSGCRRDRVTAPRSRGGKADPSAHPSRPGRCGRSVDDARAALEFARETGDPWNLFPALALHARAAAESAPEQVDASVDELLASLTTSQPFWGAASLPDLLAVADARAPGRAAPFARCRQSAHTVVRRRSRRDRRRLRPRGRHVCGDRIAAGRGGRSSGGGQALARGPRW